MKTGITAGLSKPTISYAKGIGQTTGPRPPLLEAKPVLLDVKYETLALLVEPVAQGRLIPVPAIGE
jgi:hypothetical protein